MRAPAETDKPTMRPYMAGQSAFKSGADSPRAFLDRCLEALEAWEPTIGAFVTLGLDAARAGADRA